MKLKQRNQAEARNNCSESKKTFQNQRNERNDFPESKRKGKIFSGNLIWKEKKRKARKTVKLCQLALIPFQKTEKNVKLMNSLY